MMQKLKSVLKDSWVTKALLGVLMLSFGVWGVGDVLNPGMDPKIIATVGKDEITFDDVQGRFTREMERFKQSLGPIDSPEMKRSILDSLVQDLTRGAVIDAAAEDMGVTVTAKNLRDAIRSEPAFKDESGNFSQSQYSKVLYDSQLNERRYLQILTSELRQKTVMDPVMQNSGVPKALTDALLIYRGETRVADTLLVSTASMPAPPPPSEETIKKTYEDNVAAFTLPEYRTVKAVVVRSDELMTPDSVTDEQIKAFYDENVERYRTRETRHVQQLVFDTKDQADAARALAATGDHLADVAKKAKAGAPIDLGDLTKEAPLVKTLGAAYDLPVGEISQPVQSDLGWHLFEITKSNPEVTRDFASVTGEIRNAIAADKGTDALYDASQSLEDSATGGEPLEDIATKINGKLISIDAMDATGKDPRGLEAKGLIDNARFTKTAFSLPVGAESKLLEIPKGYYLMKVESITPPKPKPLEDVRAQVIAIADKAARLTAARDVAGKIAAEINASTPLAPIAEKNKTPLAQLGPVNRFGDALRKDIIVDAKRLSPELLEKLFTAKVGDVVSAPVADGIAIARLREISGPSNPDVVKEEATAEAALRRGIAEDLTTAMTQAYASRYPAQINSSALDTLVTSTR